MRPGGGHSKGAAWERVVCRKLSLWVSNMAREDVFWRSSMSGGRATVWRKKGKKHADAACGDVTAILPAGRRFLDIFFVECKATRNLHLDAYLSRTLKGQKDDHWFKPCAQSKDHAKSPFVILKRDRMEPMVFVNKTGRDRLEAVTTRRLHAVATFPIYGVVVFPLNYLLTHVPGHKI